MWFEIFKVGKWHGHEYTKLDLDKMVENFDKGDPRVPLIIGHNSFWGGEEKPAEGWVESLKRSGNRLMAKARNISETLKAAVNEERYPMRSVEIWHDYHGRGLALGAIAFLGGSNPEVGGMADFQFTMGSASDCADYTMRSNNGERSCFAYASKDKISEGEITQDNTHHHKGGDDMTKEEIEKIVSDAVAAGVAQFKASTEFTSLVTENQRLAAEVTETRNHAAAQAVKADLDTCNTFAKGLLDAKKVNPAVFNSGLGSFLASLDNTTELEFSAGKKQTRRAFAMETLQSQAAATSLFGGIDTDPARASDNTVIDSEVEAFAKRNGLDPKIVAEQFAAQRRNFASLSVDDDGLVSSGGISIAATKKD